MIEQNYVSYVSKAMELYPNLLELYNGNLYFCGIYREIYQYKLEYFTSFDTLLINSETYFDVASEYVDIRLEVLNQNGKLLFRLKKRLSDQVCIGLHEMNIKMENRPNSPYSIEGELFNESHYDMMEIARKQYINNIIND